MCSYVGHVRGPCTAKTTEPQVNRFGLCTRVGPGNHVLNGVPDTPREGELQGGHVHDTHGRVQSVLQPDAVNSTQRGAAYRGDAVCLYRYCSNFLLYSPLLPWSFE